MNIVERNNEKRRETRPDSSNVSCVSHAGTLTRFLFLQATSHECRLHEFPSAWLLSHLKHYITQIREGNSIEGWCKAAVISPLINMFLRNILDVWVELWLTAKARWFHEAWKSFSASDALLKPGLIQFSSFTSAAGCTTFCQTVDVRNGNTRRNPEEEEGGEEGGQSRSEAVSLQEEQGVFWWPFDPLTVGVGWGVHRAFPASFINVFTHLLIHCCCAKTNPM